MTKNGYKTINVRPSTKERLAEKKIHPNQSFDEVVNEILDDTEDKNN